MTVLLDVNVVIAMIDAKHVAHRVANDWFDQEGAKAWATCSTVQNGVIRIVGTPIREFAGFSVIGRRVVA